MLKVKILVSHLDQATDSDLAEMQLFLRRQAGKIKAAARPKKGKKPKTYKALLEAATPVTVLSTDPATDSPKTPDGHLGVTPVEDPRSSDLNPPQRDVGPGGVLDPNN